MARNVPADERMIWIALSALVLVAGVHYLFRLRAARQAALLDDAAIREIERTGRLDEPDDEPLDVDEIAAAEERFWAEEWDEPEEYER